MNYKDLIENLLTNIGSELDMMKKLYDTICVQMEQIDDLMFHLENKKDK